MPNTDPARFMAVTAAMGSGVSAWISPVGQADAPAGLILARRSRRRLELKAGYLGLRTLPFQVIDVVYGGLLGPTDEKTRVVFAEHLHSVLTRREAEAIVLHSVSADDPVIGALRALDARMAIVEQPHLTFRLGATYDQTISHLSSKHRYNVKRMDRVLVEKLPGVRLRVVTDAADVESLARRAAAVTRAGYQGALEVGFLASAPQVAAIVAEAQAGRLLAYVLESEDRLIAYQIGSRYGTVYFLEATAFLPEHRALSPGSVLMHRVMADLIARGVEEIDYGYGDAPYKRQFCTRVWNEVTVTILAPTLKSAVTRAVMGGLSLATRASGPLAPTVQRLKAAWRRRLERSATPASPGLSRPAEADGSN